MLNKDFLWGGSTAANQIEGGYVKEIKEIVSQII